MSASIPEGIGIHSRPWISVDQAKIELLPLANGNSIQVSMMTSSQFIDAISLIVNLTCDSLSDAKAKHLIEKVNEVFDGLDKEDLSMQTKWYIIEELERIGIIFATTLARKYGRTHRNKKP